MFKHFFSHHPVPIQKNVEKLIQKNDEKSQTTIGKTFRNTKLKKREAKKVIEKFSSTKFKETKNKKKLRNCRGKSSISKVQMQAQFQPKIFIENESDFLSMAKKCCSNEKYLYIKKKLSSVNSAKQSDVKEKMKEVSKLLIGRKIPPKITPNNSIIEMNENVSESCDLKIQTRLQSQEAGGNKNFFSNLPPTNEFQ